MNSSKDDVERRVAEALAAHDRGWKVFPTRGKAPLLNSHGCNDPRRTREQVELDARTNSEMAVATGDLIVIDVDPRNGGSAGPLNLPLTPTVVTAGEPLGEHYYFLCPPDVQIGDSESKLAPGVDVRGAGGYALIAGSIHPKTGRQYRWAPGRSPADLDFAVLPESIVARLIPPRRSRKANGTTGRPSSRHGVETVEREYRRVADAPKGKRNPTLNKAAFTLGQFIRDGVVERSDVEARLRPAFAPWGEDQKSENTMSRAIDAGIASPRATGARDADTADGVRNYLLTEGGNAERLRDSHGADLRYCHDWKRWLAWDGMRFALDRTGATARRAKEIGRQLLRAAAEITNDDVRKETVAWALKSDSAAKRRATVELATAEDGIPVLPDQLDRDPFLLNVLNGTLDLRTGTLRPHAREDLITKLAPIVYDPAANAPRWLAFLEEVVPDSEVRAFLQRAFFLSLTGDVTEHVLFFLYGTGNNGKSTFLRVLLAVAGEYGKQVADELLVAKNHDAHPTEKADLFGLRSAVTTELPDGRSFNEALIKRLTGGDVVSARRMNENFWNFDPTHHLWIGGNHKPYIRGRHRGIWRRVQLIPFIVDVANPDPRLLEKLLTELPGILAWAVRGGAAWRERSLDPPPAIREATDEYRAETDILGPFIEECCIHDPKGKAEASSLFAAYLEWTWKANVAFKHRMNQTQFGKALTERGFPPRKQSGKILRIGLRLQHTRTVGDSRPGSLSRDLGILCEPGNRPEPSLDGCEPIFEEPGL